MFKKFLSGLFLLISVAGTAQNSFDVGVNILPIIANSYELTAEYPVNKRISVSTKLGYAFENGLRVVMKVGDNVKNKTHSGYFGKIGLKYYFTNNITLLGNLIYSNYKNTGEIINDQNELQSLTSSGSIWALGLTPGYRINLKNKPFSFIVGLQIGFSQKRDDFIGTPLHNYQPGLGAVGETYFQGVFNIMYSD